MPHSDTLRKGSPLQIHCFVWHSPKRSENKSMDTALKNAEARRSEAKAELEQLQAQVRVLTAELDRIDRFIQDWREFAGVSEPDVAPHEVKAAGPRRKPRNPPREEIGDAVAAILDERNEPILRDPLFDELEQRGIHLVGKDPRMILSTMIWRMSDRFIRLPPHGYWFKDRPFHPANYDPEAISRARDIAEEHAVGVARLRELEKLDDPTERDVEEYGNLETEIGVLEDRYPELKSKKGPGLFE